MSFVIQVPVLQNNSGPPLVGLVTIACHLVKESKRPDLLGDSAESRAVVQQWLEHKVTKLDRCRKDDIKTFLKVYVDITNEKNAFRIHACVFFFYLKNYLDWIQSSSWKGSTGSQSVNHYSLPTSKVLFMSARLDKGKNNTNTH